jgi:imidazolonepropionase
MIPRPDLLIVHAQLATLASGLALDPIADGAVAVADGRILWVGATREIPGTLRDSALHEIDAGGRLVTPGLIDCHTHLVFAGNRAREFEMRLEGASYEDIARAGGGIVSSMQATRAASFDALLRASLPRARDLVADGVTTLEIKSGYALEAIGEARMLEVARRIGVELGISVRTTFLGAHAVPPEYSIRPDDWIDAVVDMLPALAAEGLVDAVDAFGERIGFTLAQVTRVFEAARTLGLPVKLHADQLSNQHGAALAASHGALSADHLEYTDPAGIAAMAGAGTVAVMLPGSFYALRETQLPPIEAFRAAGVPLAVASDLNPGTSPVRSLRVAMNLAATLFRMTPVECLLGATAHAARALGLGQHKGRLVAGHDADLVIWEATDAAELSYWIGGRLARTVIARGRVYSGMPES